MDYTEHAWTITEDGLSRTSIAMVDANNQVLVSYEILAELLTRLGYVETPI